MSYLSFLWKSTNDHGIHSPFVYSFISTAFYNGHQLPELKRATGSAALNKQALQTLYKIIANKKAFKLLVLGDNATEVTDTIRNVAEQKNSQLWFFSPLASVPGGLDLGIITGTNRQAVMEQLHRLQEDVNQKSIIAIPNIHATPQMEQAWETIKKDPNVTVTIDTYHLGLISLRNGQAKQHFLIRPYKSFFTDALLGARRLWGLLG
ncbi:hypothetical protein ACLI1A_14210 [Flavobacterium sp. RHBU_3]|uniref:hypothetical protein n=1 Tax=Flavobacterium sp. RHBU_3 TaxID=3391184 RepID=UPI003984B9D9